MKCSGAEQSTGHANRLLGMKRRGAPPDHNRQAELHNYPPSTRAKSRNFSAPSASTSFFTA